MIFQCEEAAGERICEQPCPVRHCEFAQSAVRRQFREGWKQGRIVGPLERHDGHWLVIGEGFNPWPSSERKSETPAVNGVVGAVASQ